MERGSGQKTSVAIVGLGRIGGMLEDDGRREKPATHAGAIAANPDCVLAAGCDIDEERRRLFAERWSGASPQVYGDAGEMLDLHHPDILVIATHPDSHARYCALAADRKVPVVICEKPLADNRKNARRIAALEKSGALKIITNHERRYAEDYLKAKAVLDEGKLGRLLSAAATLYMGKTRRLLDVLWHDGTHLVDALMFLSGSVMEHKRLWGAKLDAGEGTAWLSGLLRPPAAGEEQKAARGAPVPFVIEIGAGRDHLVFEIECSCERGRLRIGNGIFEIWESAESPYAENFRSLVKTPELFEGPTGYFANMLKDALACVRDPARQPRSTAADGLRVIEYLHSVRRWL